METEVVVVHAERAPMKGVADPGPHQIYKNPQISVEQRTLQELAPDKIRVQMLYAGLCGTDMHLAERVPETGYIRNNCGYCSNGCAYLRGLFSTYCRASRLSSPIRPPMVRLRLHPGRVFFRIAFLS